MQPAERRWDADFQQPARLRVAPAHKILGFLAQAQDVDDALEIAGTRLGERELARRALEQAGTQALLELAHALGDDRRR